MSQFEYSVGLAPMQPEETQAVAFAFLAGQNKAIDAIKRLANDSGNITTTIFEIDNLFKNKDKHD